MSVSETHRAGAWVVSPAPVPALTATVDRVATTDVLFIGDLHLDHPTADRAAVKRLLDDARERNAAIALLGDVFDVMQGFGDKRQSKSELAARYTGRDDYLTAVLEDVLEVLEPYADLIWVVLQGNHESSVARYNGVHLEQLLAHELRRAGGACVAPGYETYALLRFRFREADGKADAVVPLWLTHGYGGGGEVTKGTIQAARRAVTYPDARIVVSGHIHSSYFIAHEQHRVTARGIVYDVEQEHYVVNTAKNEHKSHRGWHVERGRGPRKLSGWWGSFRRARGEAAALSASEKVSWDFYRAKP
jgi:hypothetical protein